MSSALTWTLVPSPASEGQILLCVDATVMYALAPPGVGVWVGEPLPVRTRWRQAVWLPLNRSDDPVLELDEPDDVCAMTTAEVIELAPLHAAYFVRRAVVA